MNVVLDFGGFRFRKVQSAYGSTEPHIALQIRRDNTENGQLESEWKHVRYITKEDLKEIIPFFTNW